MNPGYPHFDHNTPCNVKGCGRAPSWFPVLHLFHRRAPCAGHLVELKLAFCHEHAALFTVKDIPNYDEILDTLAKEAPGFNPRNVRLEMLPFIYDPDQEQRILSAGKAAAAVPGI